MPPALDEERKERVWKLWLSGETRKNIAEICEIEAGSVTNIINEKTKDLDNLGYGAIRDLAVQVKKEGMSFADLASLYRRRKYIEKVDANEDEVESLIANLVDGTKSIPNGNTADLVNQLYELSESESVPPAEVPAYIKQKIEEKQRLDEEIQKARAILDQETIDIRTIEEYKKLEKLLKSHCLSVEDPHKLVSILQTFDEMGCDSQKIVASLARIKSFRQTERRLKKNCRFWESRAAHYKEAFRMCERVVSNGIGIPLLLALETAVIKKIEVDGIPAGDAPYRILEEIDDYKRLGGVKKQLYDTIMQLSMASQIMARQERVINTLTKLQISSMTEGQILNACRFLEVNGRNSSPDSNNSHFG